jgi:hypothetical protein
LFEFDPDGSIDWQSCQARTPSSRTLKQPLNTHRSNHHDVGAPVAGLARHVQVKLQVMPLVVVIKTAPDASELRVKLNVQLHVRKVIHWCRVSRLFSLRITCLFCDISQLGHGRTNLHI